ncbi:MAG: insulinase family protein [Acidobacteria bacterium]|nr:insulinase family protein [Acidobacteriota bacterium]
MKQNIRQSIRATGTSSHVNFQKGSVTDKAAKTATPQAAPAPVYFRPEPVIKHRLPNGLKVLLKEDHSNPIVTTMIWYRVGSRNERPGITGVSHLLEHMMFKGTDRYDRGAIDFLTMVNGGTNNAFTSNDYTAYYFSFASDRWEHSLEIEANRMRNNVFVPEEFQLEKQVVIEELKMDLDTPWAALRKAVESKAFRKHPYRFPVIGRLEDLRRLTLQQLRRHYRTFYSPNNATLVVVGDIDPEDALTKIRCAFEPIPPGVIPPIRIPAESEQERPRQVWVRMHSNVARMLAVFRSPAVTSSDIYVISIIDKILSEGKLSRLFQRFVEQEKLVSFVTTEFSESIDPHLFYVRAELNPGAEPRQVEAALFDELEKLHRQPLTTEELQRARNQLSAQYLSGFETTIDQAIQYGLFETIASHTLLEDYMARIHAVTTADIQAVAQKYFQRHKSTLGFVSA